MDKLTGYKGRTIEIRSEIHRNDKIAFFYPGMRYGSDSPLFYYIIRLMRILNIDICFFEFEWNKLPLAENASKSETVDVMKSEIQTSMDYIRKCNGYEKKFLISKSVGSLVAETFPAEFLASFDKAFYFTPFVNVEKCLATDSFLYYGGNDQFIEEKYKVVNYTDCCRYYPALDHSLMIENTIQESIGALQSALKDFEQDLRGSL